MVAPVLAERLRDSRLTADEVIECYCAAVYAQTGSYRKTARRLGLDGRTVSGKVAAWNRRRRGPAERS